jgi:creatinine amidohydrolase
MSAYTTSGVIGRPSLASPEKGKSILDSLVQSFADVLDALGGLARRSPSVGMADY